MYALIVTLRVKPEERERFLMAAEDDSTCSLRDEPGCLRFDVLQDTSDPNRYYFYEVYRDEAAFEEHMLTPHFERWAAAAEGVLDGRSQRITAWTVFPRDSAARG